MTIYHEDAEFDFGPRLWDAGEGVCCAAFQLGACAHTESRADDAEPVAFEASCPWCPAVIAAPSAGDASDALVAHLDACHADAATSEPF